MKNDRVPVRLAVEVYDSLGNAQSWAWLRAKWGNVNVSEFSRAWKTVRLQEDCSGSTATVVECIDGKGNPMPGVTVTNSWPGDSVPATTGENGACEFCWGGGSYYQDTGPMSIACEDVTVSGLGWLWESNHHHLNLIFSCQGEEPQPDIEKAKQKLTEAKDSIDEALAILEQL